MDPHAARTQQDASVVGPFHRISPARMATGLSSGLRKTITFIAEPLSPARSEWDLESAPSTPGLEKFRRWSTIRKSTDASNISATRPVTPEEPRNFMTLPQEIQIVILQHLDFGDIERLRRTCKYWYNFATPRLVRSIWGPDTFRAILIRHCRVCLTYCPRDVARLITTPLDAGYPLSSRCVKCTVQSRDGTVRIGRKTTLGNFTDYWTCRWCGWPITNDSSTGHSQFHKRCYDRYAVVLLAFFLLGWIQFSLGMVGSGLCWHYFRSDHLVFAPTIIGFLMMWFCIVLIMFRGNKVRTYHVALFLELAIVGLWVPPVYSISKGLQNEPPSKSTTATLVILGVNMVFRLVNVIGNIILISEYDRTRHYVPRIPIWRRFMNPVLTALIFWTYPQHAERKFPPDYS
ncbi:hypothetical protein diail_12108 [Diaporthe ilicicola]|nr:hypothetical protein diail_12108 [Diaporthe ilicicola]